MTEAEIREAIAANGGRGIIIAGVSNEDYHGGPGLSSTGLKTILTHSVGKYLYEKANPKESSAALTFGNAWHTKILEADEFKNRYFTEQELPAAPPRNKKEGKDLYADWEKEHLDYFATKYGANTLDAPAWQIEYTLWKHPEFSKKTQLKDKEIELMKVMEERFREHPILAEYLNGAKTELSIYWIDKTTGLLCKCRPDILNQELGVIGDLKTCQDISAEEFRGDITFHLYHLSAAFYVDGVEDALGERLNFVYIPSEKNYPFFSTHYRANEASLEAGQLLYQRALRRFARYSMESEKLKAESPEKKIWIGMPIQLTDIDIRTYGYTFDQTFAYDNEQ
ncbi:hypothetical protein MASR1M48_16520 [Lactococcus petauri]